MANTGKNSAPSTPVKSKPPAKGGTPPRKLNVDRSPLKSFMASKNLIVCFKEVGIQGVCIAFCNKPDGISPSYIAPIICYLDDANIE